MSTVHVLKVQPPYFDALLDGSKTFEVRKNDRGFQRGDVLHLVAWEGIYRSHCRGCETCSVRKVVTYVYAGDPRFGSTGGLAPGFVVLGLADPEATS